MKTCPVCNTGLRDDPQFGPYCPDDSCPVEDDWLLWYQNGKGEWKAQKWIYGPWVPHPDGGMTASMTLSEKEP